MVVLTPKSGVLTPKCGVLTWFSLFLSLLSVRENEKKVKIVTFSLNSIKSEKSDKKHHFFVFSINPVLTGVVSDNAFCTGCPVKHVSHVDFWYPGWYTVWFLRHLFGKPGKW